MEPEKDVFDQWLETTEVVDGGPIEIVKKGGPRGPRKEKPHSLQWGADELVPAIRSLGSFLCRRLEVAELSTEDVSDLSAGIAPVLNKYLGDAWTKFGPELALLAVLLKVGAPRWEEYSSQIETAQDTPEAVVKLDPTEDF